ncbi:MAG: type II toxin-antitoxin system HicA family toxin [Betaproteobacteria bacterium]|nr:type II toxin-antitoxin system HicA family toxin [Betaproteobacteria bacterium]
MHTTQRKTLVAIFTDPVSPAIAWRDVESLFKACGGVIKEGRGSRVWFVLGKDVATFHRPHPKPDTDKGAVKAVRRFFKTIGITP